MSSLITLLETYKYVILFPIAIFEGPIVTVICGFLISMGYLNIFLVYPIVVLGDIVGDGLCYVIGRWGFRLVDRHGHRLGITKQKVDQVRVYFNTHRKKALFFSKVLHGLGFIGLIVAGLIKIPYRKFFTVCALTTAVQAIILLASGLLFGRAYYEINNYLNFYAAATFVVGFVIATYFFTRKFTVKIEENENTNNR